MMPRGGNQKDLLKQAQKLQNQLMKAQEELANATVQGTAGGGVVTVTINGQYHVQEVRIDPDAVSPDDVEMLQDLVTAAVNEALEKVQSLQSQSMGALTGGLKIPGLM
jgi:DNA-binding YbaB/EbfC family protein